MRNLITKASIILFIFVLAACQDNNIEEIQVEEIDQDMINALNIADEYLSARGARTQNSDKAVTVIKFQADLIYKTNTVNGSYQPINEETVTAMTQSGDYVFWHPAGQVEELIDIDFDEESEEILGDHLPFQLSNGKAWALYVPTLDNDSDVYLKYDIVYKLKSGEVVRLDPKLKINAPE